MQYHKIRGVDKTVCTAEQKIAYELAFRAHINYGRSYRAQMDKAAEAARCDAIYEILQRQMNIYRDSKLYGKYNEDAIFCCLNAGLKNYMEKPFIASMFEQIGQAFPAYYL
jgi:hypothetical protein